MVIVFPEPRFATLFVEFTHTLNKRRPHRLVRLWRIDLLFRASRRIQDRNLGRMRWSKMNLTLVVNDAAIGKNQKLPAIEFSNKFQVF